jgi:DNA polymerase III alpha subunit (gram-positive type)
MPGESVFKRKLIEEIKKKFPGAIVLKNDANAIQGIPDHLILFGPNWAAFDAKQSKLSPKRPNQEYYIRKMDAMSLAAFVYPDNKEWFLDELQQTLRLKR